jgi:hypothetical protein
MLRLLEMSPVWNQKLLLLLMMMQLLMMMMMQLLMLMMMMQLRLFAPGSAPLVAVCWGCAAAATQTRATGPAHGAVLPP